MAIAIQRKPKSGVWHEGMRIGGEKVMGDRANKVSQVYAEQVIATAPELASMTSDAPGSFVRCAIGGWARH